MTTHTIIYEPSSVIVVPFPFTDSTKSKRRPAVVLSSTEFQIKTNHITLLMVTSALHTRWFGDHIIKDLHSAGLPSESIIRQKIFTIDIRLIIREIGKLSIEDARFVQNHLKKHIVIEEFL